MRAFSLQSKLLLVSGLVFLSLSIASSGILYNAQKRQAAAEMNEIMTSEIIALSTLVSSRPGGRFDFEISDSFLSQYKSLKPNGFFRFIDPRDQHIFFESPKAPKFNCDTESDGKTSVIRTKETHYRFRTSIFHPQIDLDWKGSKAFEPTSLCLIVGLDETPYRTVVVQTLITTIPILIVLFGFLTVVLVLLVKSVTKDLSLLVESIGTSDFSATHEFPRLPEMQTLEVKAVAEKLRDLHDQAAQVYKEMWLFLGRAAHQIKTPVAAMQATLDVLLRKDRTKEELLTGLVDVRSATNSLNNLTRKLISSSRIAYRAKPTISSISIHKFFQEQISAFSSLAHSRSVILKIAGEESLEIESDFDLLSEIFSNLIENAILYSPTGKGAPVQISWNCKGQDVGISVSNTGAGIPENVKRTLGAPFVRGDERQNFGSGLGLSIVTRAAALLSAQLDIISDSARTVVTLTIPQKQTSERYKLETQVPIPRSR